MSRSITRLLPLVVGLSVSPLSGQAPSVPQQASATAVQYKLTPERFVLSFLTLTYDERSIEVKFSPTERLPGAKGEARVVQENGVAEIAMELDEMKPAWSFGGDFNTYVLWAVSPEGHMDNLGEFILDGDRGKLTVSTRLDTFGLIVTAEPHFMAEKPSPFVVLLNRDPGGSMRRPSQLVQLELADREPQYRFELESLESVPKVHGDVSSALRQAHVAVHLAAAAGAERLAPDQFREAQESLYRTQGAAETRSPTDPDVERMARRTVSLAVAAQKLARGRDTTRQ